MIDSLSGIRTVLHTGDIRYNFPTIYIFALHQDWGESKVPNYPYTRLCKVARMKVGQVQDTLDKIHNFFSNRIFVSLTNQGLAKVLVYYSTMPCKCHDWVTELGLEYRWEILTQKVSEPVFCAQRENWKDK